MEKKGFKIIRMDIEVFFDIFRSPKHLELNDYVTLTRFDLPDDARAVCAEYDLSYDAFFIKIESDEFPLPSKGERADIIEPKKISIKIPNDSLA